MKNVSRKVLSGILVVMGVAVLGIGAFVVLQIQSNQAPASSFASGFGDTATRTVFQMVYDKFKSLKCEDILSLTDLKTVTSTEFGDLATTNQVTIADIGADVITPKFCNYDFGNGKSFLFTINNYNATSPIAATVEDQYAKVNGALMLNNIKIGTVGAITYFFGDEKEGTSCQTTLFHKDNDFDYASLYYTGVPTCQYDTVVDFNDQVTKIIATHINTIMDAIYQDAAQKGIVH